MNNERMVLAGVGVVVVALILLSRPNCKRGCRSVAEHLFEHGVDEIVAGLLA
jgi:hypothetical protein